MCWLCCCSSFVCGAMAAAAAHNPPQTKAINQHKTNPPQQNNNSISLLAFHAQPQRKELFCVLLWLAAELLAPWGGLHSQTQSIRSLPSSLNYFISFHNSKQRRKQAQVDWFVRSTLSFSFICFHWVGVVALFLSAEPWSAAALITHQKQEQPNSIQQITLPPQEQQFISFIGLFPWAPQAQQSLFQSLFPFSKRRVNERRDQLQRRAQNT